MRLPLLRPADLTAEQQPLYRAFEEIVEGEEVTIHYLALGVILNGYDVEVPAGSSTVQ
jgi:hypothetical protein